MAGALGGKVVRLFRDKGFGFLKGDDGVERFFHRSAVRDGVTFEGLTEGDRVTYDDDPKNPKGPRAANIYVTTR